ncbi:carboxymuconolactone decarboxylase family protein [Amycolatopsis sp. H20-H5]|uniref:carboxymuconolactone decarboxylase family protein n=1 Tax=Amycolatopsis sp. H20-H5 TaxID=3046309 RepID=UPI002DB88A13|nr:carboxymuconolactone decarboxylase family protein [Amycolatopsis sp. H20-H5]MEC3974140.1 carboxymuconolactone decarboxylase family protein [Amycolatopsis sp. H20-H5]
MSEPMEELNRRGRARFAELVEGGEQRLDALFATIPALGELAVGTVYGHLHDRPALDPRTREAATLAAIDAAGMVGPPLSVHLRTGLASGLSPAEVCEVVLQAAAFAGFPRAVSAADQLNRLFADAGVPSPPPRAAREAVLEFCARPADFPDLATPDVLSLLTTFTRVEAQATGPGRVVAECFGAAAEVPDGLLYCTVTDGVVTGVRVFRQPD